MAQTKAQLVVGLNVNASAPASALQIDASGNVNLDSNTLYVDASNNRVSVNTNSAHATFQVHDGAFVLSKPASGSERNWRILSSDAAAGDFAIQQSTTTGGTTYSSKLQISAAGNVGIGTSSPSATLDVNGSAVIGSSLYLKGGATVQGEQAEIYNGTSFVDIYASRDSGTNKGYRIFKNNQIASEVVRIDSSGRVGIGTTTPGDFNQVVNAPHLVVGNGTTSYPGVTLYSTTAGAGIVAFADGTTGNQQYRGYIQYDQNVDQLNLGSNGPIAFNTGTERARIDSSGRLLVGTSSQGGSQLLQIQGDTANSQNGGTILLRCGLASGTVASGTGLGGIAFGDSSGNKYALIEGYGDAASGTNDYPGRLVFSTTADGASSPTERMRIKADGYIRVTNDSNYSGILDNSHQFYQSAAQWATFHVNGNANPYGIYIRYTGASPNGAGNPFLTCYDSGSTERATIRSNGGLANYSANNTNLSDINSKKDISLAAGTWDCIKEWEIVNYRYKDQPDDADLNLGVIAQQVAESCPEVITVFSEATEDEPEKLGVKEQQMYWMAIKALQEAQVRIEALEAEVAALKAQ